MIRNERRIPGSQPANVAMSNAETAPPLFVGSFPPRECGIATFTKDIVHSYNAHCGSGSDVVAIEDRSDCGYVYDSRVIGRIKANERRSYSEAALLINRHRCGVVNIQHEYGLFGGTTARGALTSSARCRSPSCSPCIQRRGEKVFLAGGIR